MYMYIHLKIVKKTRNVNQVQTVKVMVYFVQENKK